MYTHGNFDIYRVLFLTSVFVVVCKANVNYVEFTKSPHYTDLLPTNSDIFLLEVEGVGLPECAAQCSNFKYACAGIFYNKFLKSCKPLRSVQLEVRAYDSHIGWNFWRNYCDIGWDYYGGHCYYLNETLTNWNSAKALCQAQAAYLVEIDAAEENAWINGKVGTGKCSPQWQSCLAWTGGNDLDREGLFIWSRGTTMNYTFWVPPEPNSHTVDDDCIVIMYPGGSWADFPCSSLRPYLCEKVA